MQKYDKKAGWQLKQCEICKKPRYCAQHHLERSFDKKNSDVIWVCFKCHRNIHDDTETAYKKGHLKRHDFTFKPVTMKEPKKKSCSHSKSYYDSRLGYIKCQYCGKPVDSINYGTKKKAIDKKVDRKPSKMGYEQNREDTKEQKIKMGYEIQDPRIGKAEKLKKQLKQAISAVKKNAGDKEKYEFWQGEVKRIKAEMIAIQRSYED